MKVPSAFRQLSVVCFPLTLVSLLSSLHFSFTCSEHFHSVSFGAHVYHCLQLLFCEKCKNILITVSFFFPILHLTDFYFNTVLLWCLPLTILKFIISFPPAPGFRYLPLTLSQHSKSTPSCSVIYCSHFISFLQSKSSQYSLKVSLFPFILPHFLVQVHSSLIHPHHSYFYLSLCAFLPT